MPAASGVEVLITILCWTVPDCVAEAVNGVQVAGAETGVCVLLQAS